MDLSLQPKQSEVYQSIATEILYGGAAGAGKSHLLRVLAIAYCVDIPNCQVYLFRRTSPDLIANHMSGPSGFPTLLAEWIDNKVVKINYSKNQIVFWNSSTIHMCHCQHDKDVVNYQGAEIHILLMDELTHFSEDVYRFLRNRVRIGSLDVPEQYKAVVPRIVCGSNPGGIGHNWVKRTFIDFAPANAIKETPEEEGGLKRQYIPALLKDNQVLVKNDPGYEKRLSGLGSTALVQAMKDGNWDIAAGGYFDDVWERERHIIEPFDIPSSWYIDRSFDWGSSKPYSVGYWAESDGTEATLKDGSKLLLPAGSVIRIGELYGWNGNDDEGCRKTATEICADIIEYEAAMPWGKRVKPGPADSAIYTKENGDCIADDMKEMGITWVPADKRPGSRIVGWQTIRKMFKAAYQFPKEDPVLLVFNTCIHFIRTVPTLPRSNNNPEDIDTKAEDHIGDETRYRLNRKRKKIGTTKVVGL